MGKFHKHDFEYRDILVTISYCLRYKFYNAIIIIHSVGSTLNTYVRANRCPLQVYTIQQRRRKSEKKIVVFRCVIKYEFISQSNEKKREKKKLANNLNECSR